MNGDERPRVAVVTDGARAAALRPARPRISRIWTGGGRSPVVTTSALSRAS